MPEPQDPEDTEGEEASVGNQNIQRQREHIKSLEKQLKEAKTAAEEVTTLKVQLANFERVAAFDRLNIPATGAGKLFREAYQGELTDEAITAKATEYELIKAESPTAPTIPGIDQAAFARQMASLNNSQSSAPPPAAATINAAPTREAALDVLRELGVLDPTQ